MDFKRLFASEKERLAKQNLAGKVIEFHGSLYGSGPGLGDCDCGCVGPAEPAGTTQNLLRKRTEHTLHLPPENFLLSLAHMLLWHRLLF